MDVRIGYKDYTLRFVEGLMNKSDTMGECFKTLGIIEIDKSLSEIEMANTIIHEIMHAVHHTHGLGYMGNTEDAEERVINSLGNGLTQVFRDNPELTTLVFNNLGYNVEDPEE